MNAELLLALKQVLSAIEGGQKEEEGFYTQRFGQAFVDYITGIIDKHEKNIEVYDPEIIEGETSVEEAKEN